MCNVGDIIVVDSYKDRGNTLNKHSFVVLYQDTGTIQGLDYDMICNVMSSFKNEKQHDIKMRYPGNFPVVFDDFDPITGNKLRGYIKVEQLYYFKKDNLKYMVIGHMKPDIFNLLIEFIGDLNVPIEHITDNL
ncbi:MAG: hypothetical protein APF77_13740 [Clostridia bacterium BRH_c25]|nr:MAG: hypothetical protein APF77_13740 [Clostridia bacterium BRH_c25]